MEKNKDWEELEQWAENDKQRKMDTYKIDINDIENIDKHTKNVDKVVKFSNVILKILIAIGIIIAAFVLILSILVIAQYISNINILTKANKDFSHTISYLVLKIWQYIV